MDVCYLSTNPVSVTGRKNMHSTSPPHLHLNQKINKYERINNNNELTKYSFYRIIIVVLLNYDAGFHCTFFLFVSRHPLCMFALHDKGPPHSVQNQAKFRRKTSSLLQYGGLCTRLSERTREKMQNFAICPSSAA